MSSFNFENIENERPMFDTPAQRQPHQDQVRGVLRNITNMPQFSTPCVRELVLENIPAAAAPQKRRIQPKLVRVIPKSMR